MIGRTFWRDVVREIGGLDDVDEALDALEARGLVLRRPESRLGGDVEYAFKHVLIRDTAYGTLPRATRRELHAATARRIEELRGGSSELSWLLGHHWREAGEPERAMAHLVAAAERARDALATEETYDLYTRALELAQTDEDRRRIALERGPALEELEDYARADRLLAEVLPELDGVDEIEALLARGHSTLWTEQIGGDHGARRSRGRAELARAASRGVPELEGPAFALLSQAHAMRGRTGISTRHSRWGIGHWRRGSRARGSRSSPSTTTCKPPRTTGRADTRARSSCRAWRRRPAGSSRTAPSSLLRGAGMQGLALAGMGRYEEALAAADAAIATARSSAARTTSC